MEVVLTTRKALGLPPTLAGRTAVLRPRDAKDVYAYPAPEFARLTAAGILRRLATGYYVRVPQDRLDDADWRPPLHAAALGVAQADYGPQLTGLMHVSAARQLGAIPRELAVAVVAVPKQRPPLRLLGGRAVFVQRRIDALDVERATTTLGPGWCTTAEQTMLDLAHRPGLGGTDPASIEEALRALADLVDWELVDDLAAQQRRRAAVVRVKRLLPPPDGADAGDG